MFCCLIGFVDKTAYLGINNPCCFFRNLLVTPATLKIHIFLTFAIGNLAEFVGKAPACDHRTGKLCCLFNVGGSSGSDVILAEFQFFGNTATHHDCQTRNHVAVTHRIFVTFRQLHNHTKCTTTRDNRCFVHRIGCRHIDCDNGVSGFVKSCQLFFCRCHGGMAFRSHHDFIFSILEFLHGDQTFVTPCCHKCGFVDKIHQIGTGKSRCTARHNLQIDIRRQRHIANMDFENFLAPCNIGVGNNHLPVKTPRTQQCRIKDIRTVGCGNENNAFIRLEPVHFDKKLVQRLFAFIIATAKTGTAMTADGINFINENDTWRILFCLFEHVANTACTNADKHFNKIRTGNCEKRHIGFTGNRTGKQCFTCSGRANKQDTPRDTTTKTLEFLRFTQKFDNFLQILFGFIDARNILECYAAMRLCQQFCLGLAEPHRSARSALHLAHEENPYADQDDNRQKREKQIHKRAVSGAFRLRPDIDVLAFKTFDKTGIIRSERKNCSVIGCNSGQPLSLHGNGFDFFIINPLQKV